MRRVKKEIKRDKNKPLVFRGKMMNGFLTGSGRNNDKHK
jgi:hypothetical protein